MCEWEKLVLALVGFLTLCGSIIHVRSDEIEEITWRVRAFIFFPLEFIVTIPMLTYLHVRYGADANPAVECWALWLLALAVAGVVELLGRNYYAFFLASSLTFFVVPPLSSWIATCVALVVGGLFQSYSNHHPNPLGVAAAIAKSIPIILCSYALAVSANCSWDGARFSWPANAYMACDAPRCRSVFTDANDGPIAVLLILLLAAAQFFLRSYYLNRVSTRTDFAKRATSVTFDAEDDDDDGGGGDETEAEPAQGEAETKSSSSSTTEVKEPLVTVELELEPLPAV